MGRPNFKSIDLTPTRPLFDIHSPSLGTHPAYKDADSQSQKKGQKGEKFEPGWRTTVLIGLITASLVLVVNVAVLISSYSLARPDPWGGKNGVLVLFRGDCGQASSMKTWAHLAVNILSTLMLVTSSFCMQVLSAPTRAEVDAAHAKGTYLSIGMLSMTNLTKISWKRLIFWSLLGLSSIPLHFFYNAFLFSTLNANDSIAFLTSKEFDIQSSSQPALLANMSLGFSHGLRDSAYYQSSQADDPFDVDETVSGADIMSAFSLLYTKNSTSQYVRLDAADCIEEYSKPILAKYGNVALVTDVSDQTNFLINVSYTAAPGMRSWTCNDPSLEYEQSSAGAWLAACDMRNDNRAVVGQPGTGPTPAGKFKLDHCIAEVVPELCSIEVIPTLIIIVIISNAVKVVCIFCTICLLDFPLVTLGDAVTSFLRNADRTTADAGVLTAWKPTRTTGFSAVSSWWPRIGSSRTAGSHRITPKGHTWARGVSTLRWATTLCPWLILEAVAIVGVVVASSDIGFSASWATGFGVMSPDLIIGILASQHLSLTHNAMIANFPQIFISCIYVFYNGLLTNMLLAAEFSDFARPDGRKAMRVSPPRRGQLRGSYWLQVPLRYSLPVAAMTTVLHWLVSQSIFLVHVKAVDTAGEMQTNALISACGFSVQPILFAAALGLLILAFPLALGARRHPAGVPIVGGCSLAIAAACHATDFEPQRMWEVPIAYGLLAAKPLAQGRRRVGFSALHVRPLPESPLDEDEMTLVDDFVIRQRVQKELDV